MIDIQLEIQSIDYKKTIAGLCSMLPDMCSRNENPGLPERFVLKMGTGLEKMACGFADTMPDETKAELLCSLVGEYNEKITALLHQQLEKNGAGGFLHIGGIAAAMKQEGKSLYAEGGTALECQIAQTGRMILRADFIKIDYRKLAESSLFRDLITNLAEKYAGVFQELCSLLFMGVAGFLAGSFSKETEKLLVKILQKKKNRKLLLDRLEHALQEKNIWIELSDYSIERYKDDEARVRLGEREYTFSDEMQEKLLDAAAFYLNSLL